MTQSGGQPKNDAVDGAIVNEGGRQTYRAPRLRRLGSVRELTLGTSGQFTEGIAGMKRTPGPM